MEPEQRDRPTSVVLTAGYDRAPQAVALLQLLMRDGHRIAGVIVQSPFRLRRVAAMVQKGGVGALKRAVTKMRAPNTGRKASGPIDQFFAEERLERHGLRSLCARHAIPYVAVSDLNADSALDSLAHMQADGVIYCGGGILRTGFLRAVNGKVLNGHAGPLPEIRGMNAVEWSLLTGERLETTIHFIDVGVDTGPVVGVSPIARHPSDDIEELRERGIVAAITGLRRHVGDLCLDLPPRDPAAAAYRQYFTLADPLRHLLAERLEKGAV